MTLILIASTSSAQTYKSPQWNGCIQQFYDRDVYNWLSFRNGCSESVTVVFIPNNPGYGGSSMNLGPGRKDNTGYSRSEVNAKQGFELYVCPYGYLNVDAEDRYVNRVNTRFRCKQD